MINQNTRRTGAAGVMARAPGTLRTAPLLLTSTGWGALAGDTGFGAINLKAYQGAAAAVPGPNTGDAVKAGRDDIPNMVEEDQLYRWSVERAAAARERDLQIAMDKYYEQQQRQKEQELAKRPLTRAEDLPFMTPEELFNFWLNSGGDGSNTTTAPAPGSGSSVGGSNPTTGSAPGSGSSAASSGPATTT